MGRCPEVTKTAISRVKCICRRQRRTRPSPPLFLRSCIKDEVALGKLQLGLDKVLFSNMAPKRPYEEWLGGDRDRFGSLEPERARRQRRAGPFSSTPTAPEEPLRDVLRDLFLLNHLSGHTTQRLAGAARRSGASDVGDFSSAGNQGQTPKNSARDLMRRILKNCHYPALYWAEVPLRDPEAASGTAGTRTAAYPFLLPHEVLAHLASSPSWATPVATPGETPSLYNWVRKMCRPLGLSPSQTIPVGLHGDGVPFSKTDTLEQLSWSFPALPGSPRILFSAVSKKHCADARSTLEAMLSVFVWSMKVCLAGTWPSLRHDGQAFDERQDKHRAANAGKPLGITALLTEFRADWSFIKQVFNFPCWSNDCICWRCPATRDREDECSYYSTGADAGWRCRRYLPGELLRWMQQQHLPISSLFSLPHFSEACILQDWMHCVDLGVAQDLIGNLFHEVQRQLPGTTMDARMSVLLQRLKVYYQTLPPSASRLNTLTCEMIKQPNKGPKLRAKAAETRHLIPFCAALAREFCGLDAHGRTRAGLFEHLHTLATHVAAHVYDHAAAIVSCRRVCALATALEAEMLRQDPRSKRWRVKPKLHLLQEMIEFTAPDRGSPSEFWTYYDESWCGWLSRTGHSRGGPFVPERHAERLLHRFRALEG